MDMVVYLILSYLSGAIPFAYVISKIFKKIDIRKCGSGNPGATNVFRVVSKPLGVLTFFLDAMKGFIPVYFASMINPSIYFVLTVAFVTLLGHVFTIFLKFKGGKGVATGCGIFVAFAPIVTLICFMVFALVLFLSKYVALSSITAAISLPICLAFFHYPNIIILFACLVAVLVIVRHIGNIRRIIKGTESKVSDKKNI
ncbi:MAG: glycerol-3-phosphate 1-O-acyltransferase PlsY [Endomicrobiaceae bacterium]|nr:glycerol-3-phosphate 1-O-acyltransferase PlsY [Endomicrobiaceae bacterium]MDD3052832.1 glycerol-3-phosphate 1-O-acyltransferase PlsY [Endomicrobiaceae bacterium]